MLQCGAVATARANSPASSALLLPASSGLLLPASSGLLGAGGPGQGKREKQQQEEEDEEERGRNCAGKVRDNGLEVDEWHDEFQRFIADKVLHDSRLVQLELQV